MISANVQQKKKKKKKWKAPLIGKSELKIVDRQTDRQRNRQKG